PDLTTPPSASWPTRTGFGCSVRRGSDRGESGSPSCGRDPSDGAEGPLPAKRDRDRHRAASVELDPQPLPVLVAAGPTPPPPAVGLIDRCPRSASQLEAAALASLVRRQPAEADHPHAVEPCGARGA